MADYLVQCDLLVAPYDLHSALNSGTLWMAFSYARTIICPRLGCIKDIPTIDQFAYIYDYTDNSEHVFKLTEILKCVANESNQPNVFIEKGLQALSIMQSRSWDAHKDAWLGLYRFTDV